MTGCVSTFRTSPASDSNQLSVGLKKLELKGDTSALKTLANAEPESAWSDSSRAILKIYTAQQKKIKTLRKKNSSLLTENKKLQDNIEKLNQINLEMEKRVP